MESCRLTALSDCVLRFAFPQASAFVARLGCKAACMTAGVTPAVVDGMSAALGINLLAGQQVIRRPRIRRQFLVSTQAKKKKKTPHARSKYPYGSVTYSLHERRCSTNFWYSQLMLFNAGKHVGDPRW